MKVFVYNYRKFDEEEFFIEGCKELGLELAYTEQSLVPEIVDMAAGCDVVSVMPTPVTAPMLDRFKELGIKMICTRCIGYDHIDIQHAKEIGMIVSNITYGIEGVAEFTVMDMLMAVRRMKQIHYRTMASDFRRNDMMAGELGTMKVGIIGAGKIGISVLRDLTGFGCKLYYANRRRKPEADKYAEYVDIDTILKTCDIISLHLELNESTYHFMDAKNFAMMKKGSIFVNTARGALVDTEALIDSLESGHLAAAAIDVVENEFGYMWVDCSDKDMEDHFIGRLRKMPNVIYTYHMGYYYRTAIRDMVMNCLYEIKMFEEGKEIPNRLA